MTFGMWLLLRMVASFGPVVMMVPHHGLEVNTVAAGRDGKQPLYEIKI